MSEDNNMDINRKAIDAFYDKALTINKETTAQEVLSSILTSDFVSKGSVDRESKEEIIGRFGFFGQVIPNLKCEIQEVFNEGDNYIVRSKATGTPNGDFMGMPTDGSKSFEIMTIDIHKVVDGKIHETHHLEDWVTAMKQLS